MPLVLPARDHLRFIQRVAAAGLIGGSVHDALIAATARQAGARLLTGDRQAAPTYEAMGADYELSS